MFLIVYRTKTGRRMEMAHFTQHMTEYAIQRLTEEGNKVCAVMTSTNFWAIRDGVWELTASREHDGVFI